MVSIAGTLLAQSLPWIPWIWIDQNGAGIFHWIPNVCLLVLVGSSSIGLYPLMFILIPEIAPENVRPINCSEKYFKFSKKYKTFF